MNLFLKNGRSFKSKNIPIPKLKNIFKYNNPSKSKINYINKISLFNSNEKISSLYLKEPNKSLKKDEIIKTEYANSNQNHLLSKTLEIKKNNISQKPITEGNKNKNISNKSLKIFNNSNKNLGIDNNFKKGKILINLKKRHSVFSKESHNLKEIYGLLSLPKTPRHTSKGNPTLLETFFTSIPIEDNNISKENTQNSIISLFTKLKLKKENYDTIKLKELKNQIQKFENSENFQPNEKIIAKNLSSPERFINEKHSKRICLRKNKKNIKQINSLSTNKTYSVPSSKSNKYLNLYNKINSIYKEADINKINVQKSKSGDNYEKTNKILKNALKKINIMNDEVTEYLKGIAIEYKKEIGEFTFYNGKGIFTNHLSKIKKDENLLAFMLTNELCE